MNSFFYTPLQHLLPCLNQRGNPLNTKLFFCIWKHNRHLVEIPFHSKVSIWLKILCQLGFWLCTVRCTGSALSVLLPWKMVAFLILGETNVELANMIQKFAPYNSRRSFDCKCIWCFTVPSYELISAHWTGALNSTWVVHLLAATAHSNESNWSRLQLE